VHDARALLRQSRQRFVLPRISRDVSQLDRTSYGIEIKQSVLTQTLRFHVGEPIEVGWKAPANHSRKDWIGIYPIGANSSEEVTQVASLGLWLGVYEEEWDGNEPRNVGDNSEQDATSSAAGVVRFAQGKLPLVPAKYEVRYHHDGKHNVMTLATFEIYGMFPKQIVAIFPLLTCPFQYHLLFQ
jgi:phosphatidylethanolamine N-methyltransferase